MIKIDFIIRGTKYPSQILHSRDAELLYKVLCAGSSGLNLRGEVVKMISSKNKDVMKTIDNIWQEITFFMNKDERYECLVQDIKATQEVDLKMIANEIAQNLSFSYRYIGRVVKILFLAYMLYGNIYIYTI